MENFSDQIKTIVDEINRLQTLIKESTNKEELEEYAKQVLKCLEQLKEHFGDDLGKYWKTIGLGGIPVLIGAAATPAAVVAAIQGIGFTSGGIALGSFGASMMSFLGGGSTTSGGLVAVCQSIGATGALSTAGAVAASMSGAAAVGFAGFGCKKAYDAYYGNKAAHEFVKK